MIQYFINFILLSVAGEDGSNLLSPMRLQRPEDQPGFTLAHRTVHASELSVGLTGLKLNPDGSAKLEEEVTTAEACETIEGINADNSNTIDDKPEPSSPEPLNKVTFSDAYDGVLQPAHTPKTVKSPESLNGGSRVGSASGKSLQGPGIGNKLAAALSKVRAKHVEQTAKSQSATDNTL